MLTTKASQDVRKQRSTLHNLPAIKGKKSDSYFHSVGKKPLVNMTIGHLVDLSPTRFVDEVAVIDRAQGIRKTFEELKQDVDRLASGFLALNLRRGDRLAVWSPNRYEWYLTQMAAAKAGLILVAINAAYQASELEFCLTKTSAKAIVLPDKFYVQEYYKIICNLAPEIPESKPGFIKTKKFPHLEIVIVMTDKSLPGTFTLSEVMSSSGANELKKLEDLQSQIKSDDDALIMFTSGTTSQPKGVVHSHFTLINGNLAMSYEVKHSEGKNISCCFIPLFHIFGSHAVCLDSLVTGSTSVLSSQEYSIQKALAAIEAEKCTCVFGTPTMYIDLLRHEDFAKTDTSTIKKVIGGGARFSPEIMKQLFQAFPQATFYVGYGSTESSGVGSICEYDVNWSDEEMNHIGKVNEHFEATIVDSNNRQVPFGTEGQICFRSSIVMKGYWEDEERTREVIKNGWYHTGDIGSLTFDGYLTITGRINDLIIRGGENINPKEIEDVLNTHPSISTVQVFGVKDERLGEAICAWIKLKEDLTMSPEQVKEFCSGKMAHYKIPSYVRFVDKFPMTRTGKVQKFVMVEEMNKLIKK